MAKRFIEFFVIGFDGKNVRFCWFILNSGYAYWIDLVSKPLANAAREK